MSRSVALTRVETHEFSGIQTHSCAEAVASLKSKSITVSDDIAFFVAQFALVASSILDNRSLRSAGVHHRAPKVLNIAPQHCIQTPILAGVFSECSTRYGHTEVPQGSFLQVIISLNPALLVGFFATRRFSRLIHQHGIVVAHRTRFVW